MHLHSNRDKNIARRDVTGRLKPGTMIPLSTVHITYSLVLLGICVFLSGWYHIACYLFRNQDNFLCCKIFGS